MIPDKKRACVRGLGLWVARLALAAGVSALSLASAFAASAEKSADTDYQISPSFPALFKANVIDGTRLSGFVGIYDFRRYHDGNQPFPVIQDQNRSFDSAATAFGGTLAAQTGMIYGLSAGFGIAFSDSLHDYSNPNANLIGDGSIYEIDQGYLQYNYPGLRVRLGRQLLNTPYADTDQYTFIPRAFDGISASIHPLSFLSTHIDIPSDEGPSPDLQAEHGQNHNTIQRAAPQMYENNQYLPFAFGDGKTGRNWTVFGARMTRYSPRTVSYWTRDNPYVDNTAGLLAVGTVYTQNSPKGDLIGQYFHYTFYDTDQLDYAGVGYKTPTLLANDRFSGIEPYARVQWVHSYDSDSEKLGKIDGTIYGIKLGAEAKHFAVAAMADYAPVNRGTFRNGTMVHPYSDGSGVVYTDTMNNFIEDLGPGYAYGGRIDFRPTKNATLFTRYVRYVTRFGQSHSLYAHTGPNGFTAGVPIVHDQKSYGWDTGIQYNFGGLWKQLDGLYISNILGVTGFEGRPTFYDNRVRFYYKF